MLADAISPLPPIADFTMPWDGALADPVLAIGQQRSALGDTFAVQSGGMAYLFVFGADGVRWFYDVDERVASKGVADWRMLLRKLPDELFLGRRTLPHELFGRDDVARYRQTLDQAIDDELAAIAETESDDGVDVEAFGLTRRIGHRLGLASWGGPGFVTPTSFDTMVDLLDQLDASDAFVRPDKMAEIAATEKAAERAALAALVDVVGKVLADPGADTTAFEAILDRWSDVPSDEALLGATYDLVLVHLGSMSNLFAAMGWLLIDLAMRPQLWAAAQSDATLFEQCALESTRLAQRSIMLREVVGRDVTLIDGHTTYRLAPGVTVVTLLPLTNKASADLELYRPARWKGRRLGDVTDLAARELVTTFGHGKHTCPAQPFSLYAMTETARRLFARFDVQPEFSLAEPRRIQIGGIARAEHPCPLRVTAR